MGVCNSPENREKAIFNMTKTSLFKQLFSNIEKSNKTINSLEEYILLSFDLYYNTHSAISHIKRIINMLSDLKKDSRWNSILDSIFQIPENFNDFLNKLTLDHFKDSYQKSLKKNNTLEKSFLKRLIDRVRDERFSGSTWNDYITYTRLYHKNHAKNHLNKIIDYLPIMKTLLDWNETLEKIFGNLTEEDKL